jgi:hypothetical protein
MIKKRKVILYIFAIISLFFLQSCMSVTNEHGTTETETFSTPETTISSTSTVTNVSETSPNSSSSHSETSSSETSSNSSSSPAPSQSDFKAIISSPKSGEINEKNVNVKVDIFGGIPNDKYLWLVVDEVSSSIVFPQIKEIKNSMTIPVQLNDGDPPKDTYHYTIFLQLVGETTHTQYKNGTNGGCNEGKENRLNPITITRTN